MDPLHMSSRAPALKQCDSLRFHLRAPFLTDGILTAVSPSFPLFPSAIELSLGILQP